jgi:hypothetical protein
MPKRLVCFVFTLALLLRLAPALAVETDHTDGTAVTLYKWLVVSTCDAERCTGGSNAGKICTTDNDCAGYVDGVDIAPVVGSEPYSPKATCARVCHLASGDTQHDYGSGLKTTVHTQGVKDGPNNMLYWQVYGTKAFEHGVSIGRHMNHGRNEDYTHLTRSTFGDPWFTSTPGMAGKF